MANITTKEEHKDEKKEGRHEADAAITDKKDKKKKKGAAKILKGLGGILVPGGFGERGIEGKIKAAQYARENKIPYLGLCLGMQIATIEFARNVAGLKGANSTEFDKETPHPVISLIALALPAFENGTVLVFARDAVPQPGGVKLNEPPAPLMHRLPF